MQIKLIVVGKLKERYWREAADEYLKRLSPFAKIDILEVAEERLPDNPSGQEILQCLKKEGERIEKQCASSQLMIPLAIRGKQLTSEEFAAQIEKFSLEGKNQLAFIIGGSYGLSDGIVDRGAFSLSFSPMTFPHQMMRVILLEQLYRAFSIINGGKYHK